VQWSTLIVQLTQDPDKGKQVALQEEFVTLLSQQLASQRQYYQQQLRRLDRDDAVLVRHPGDYGLLWWQPS
jgi:hypothetical protein